MHNQKCEDSGNLVYDEKGALEEFGQNNLARETIDQITGSNEGFIPEF